MYKEFWRLYIKGYGGGPRAMLICAVSIVVSMLEGFNIGLLLPLLETLDTSGEGNAHWVSRAFGKVFDALGLPFELKTILLGLAVLILASAALKYLRMILAAKTTVRFTVWMKSKAMEGFLHADVSYFHQKNLGELNNTLTIQSESAGGTFSGVTEFVSNTGITVAYLVAAFLISPILTGVAFAITLLLTLSMQHFIVRARALGERQVLRTSEVQMTSLENLSGIRVIKSFLLERFRWSQFNSKAVGLSEVQYGLSKNRSQMLVLQEAAMFALIGVIVFVGVSVLHISLAVTVSLLFILYRLAPRITNLNTVRQSLAATMASLRDINTTIEAATSTKIISGETPFAGLSHGIEFRSVGFSYEGTTDVLDDTNFTIEKGQMTAIVGTSGAGKSTIVDLIMRYYDPIKGKVLVDGVDLKELDIISWRSSTGMVSQDIFLFNDTIANNILLVQPEATAENVMEAATRAYAHDFIKRLPRGYDTIVGDRGLNLSGGERQRIALARAILKKPEILILDEATSSLDSESEQLIQNYIRDIRGACTLVVVAHRISTIQDADKIIVVQDGKIVEEGDKESLLAGAGVFASFHSLQSNL